MKEPRFMYIEVDLKDKELPTGKWGYTMEELAEECGKKVSTIKTAISRSRSNGVPCKYVQVWL